MTVARTVRRLGNEIGTVRVDRFAAHGQRLAGRLVVLERNLVLEPSHAI